MFMNRTKGRIWTAVGPEVCGSFFINRQDNRNFLNHYVLLYKLQVDIIKLRIKVCSTLIWYTSAFAINRSSFVALRFPWLKVRHQFSRSVVAAAANTE